MRPQTRRHALVFSLALALPCAVLIFVGVRMIRDGDELAARRQVEEHARTVARIRSGLIARLARVTADVPAVAMMARLETPYHARRVCMNGYVVTL